MDMNQAWVIIVVNAVVVVFGAGVTYMRVRHNTEKITALGACRTDIDELGKHFGKQLEKLNVREGRHYRNILVALTAITAGGNPKSPMDLIRQMAKEDGG